MAVQTMSEMKAHILAKAAEDPEFRANLLADPKAAISSELEVFIPQEFNIQVHEDGATTTHLVLPLSDQLSDAELALAAAGVDVNWDTVNIS